MSLVERLRTPLLARWSGSRWKGFSAALAALAGRPRGVVEETGNPAVDRAGAVEQMRADLIATVSHEFRTPLTGIRGAALTLLKHGDRLEPAARQQLLQAVLEQQQRLFRTLENMLVAAEAAPVDPWAVAEVDAVATEVAMLASASASASAGAGAGPQVGTAVLVKPGTLAQIDRQALHQVLANLLTNAQQHSRPGAIALITGGQDAAGVWLTVSNEGADWDPGQSEWLFEPFTQATRGPTRDRQGLGLGLYIVRRLVERYGGSVRVRSAAGRSGPAGLGGTAGWVSVQVRLRPAPGQPPTSEPIP